MLEACRHQDLDQFPEQFIVGVPEQAFERRVGQYNPALVVNDDGRVRRGDQQPRTLSLDRKIIHWYRFLPLACILGGNASIVH
jgi:hypothetical protein